MAEKRFFSPGIVIRRIGFPSEEYRETIVNIDIDDGRLHLLSGNSIPRQEYLSYWAPESGHPKNIITEGNVMQIGGTHYEDMDLQPWEVIQRANLDFWEGNVVKYVMRYKTKSGVEDLKKARHYLDYLIERENR